MSEGGDALLVVRGVDGVDVHRLKSAVYAFLLALGRTLCLADAVERATAADAAFDLAEALRTHIAMRTIVAFHAP